jgi:hypothetical protein
MFCMIHSISCFWPCALSVKIPLAGQISAWLRREWEGEISQSSQPPRADWVIGGLPPEAQSSQPYPSLLLSVYSKPPTSLPLAFKNLVHPYTSREAWPYKCGPRPRHGGYRDLAGEVESELRQKDKQVPHRPAM